jgi:uncharacterized protein (TIGR03032 family)
LSLAPLRSVYTAGLPELFADLGISLFVTTYQAGKLVIIRADDGHGAYRPGEYRPGEYRLNTHFRPFPKPMGLALYQNRLALGVTTGVYTFQDIPAVARKLDPPGQHDACFLPRRLHYTGDILVHEMAWAAPADQPPVLLTPNSLMTEPELWLVNTRFSCLCTLHPEYSFTPRWQPRFISSLSPEDRCHLNGLALVDGRPRFVTALGESDAAGGWRERKKDGGVLIDVPSGEIVLRGLSMPHSPRWYNQRLWALNSGAGQLGLVEMEAGVYRPIARLPGFTRGLDFYDRYAFVGLSQIRESATFSGIPVADLPLEQRACGVWVLDIITGAVIGFVRFEDAVQEIFAVQVAAGRRYPDLITDDASLLANSFVLPDAALQRVPTEWRTGKK